MDQGPPPGTVIRSLEFSPLGRAWNETQRQLKASASHGEAIIMHQGPTACDRKTQGLVNFFDREFAWGEEVVAVRTGVRRWVDNGEHRRLLQGRPALAGASSSGSVELYIEDPFELHRNLGNVLRVSRRGERLRDAIRRCAAIAEDNPEQILDAMMA